MHAHTYTRAPASLQTHITHATKRTQCDHIQAHPQTLPHTLTHKHTLTHTRTNAHTPVRSYTDEHTKTTHGHAYTYTHSQTHLHPPPYTHKHTHTHLYAFFGTHARAHISTQTHAPTYNHAHAGASDFSLAFHRLMRPSIPDHSSGSFGEATLVCLGRNAVVSKLPSTLKALN